MATVEKSMEVFAPVEECYQLWSEFDQFPRFMKHVKTVERTAENDIWHWTVDGPLGRKVEWDAHIYEIEPNRIIAWHTVDGSEIKNSGEVRFEDLGNNNTRIDVSISYEPPAGIAGELVADVFKNPEHMVEEDLQNFHRLLIETNQPLMPYAQETTTPQNTVKTPDEDFRRREKEMKVIS